MNLVLFVFVFCCFFVCLFVFFFNDTATTEIYTLSLHDALPICNVYIYRVCFAKNYTVFRIWGTQFSTIHVVLCPDNYTDSFLSCWAWLNGQGNSFAHLFPWKVFLGDTIFIIIGGSDLLASQQNLLSFSKNQMKISRVVCSMIQSLNLPKMYFGEF